MNFLNTENQVTGDFFRLIFFHRFCRVCFPGFIFLRTKYILISLISNHNEVLDKIKNKQNYEVQFNRKNFSILREKLHNYSSFTIFQKKKKFNSTYIQNTLVKFDKFVNLVLINNFKKFKEAIISFLPKNRENWQELGLDYFPKWMKLSMEQYLKLNNFQAKLFPFIFGSDCNLLIGAPTGVGKTVLIILSILRLIVNSIKLNIKKGSLNQRFLKVLYIAPLKALVKEIVKTLKNCFNHLGFITCEVTGDTLIELTNLNLSNFIVGTPDKIESILQKNSKIEVFKSINLLIIDEIHFIKEEKGAVLENLLIYFKNNFKKKKDYFRTISLSATIPNFFDLAKFLNVSSLNGVFYFGPLIRENPLSQVVLSINSENNNLNSLKLLNEVLVQKTLTLINSFKKPKILIFVQSRKDTYNTGFSLIKKMQGKHINSSGIFESIENVYLKKIPFSFKNLLRMGIGIHHSGLSKKEKNFMENKFKSGLLHILITTNTLAWGVNLNAKNVIIKGTKIYSQKKASWVEISGTNIVQMLGRTGRFNSDKYSSSFLLTVSTDIERYLKIIKNKTPVESTILSNLPDYLNIEIAFNRIYTFLDALNWFSQTFLWIRIKRLLSKKLKQKNNSYMKKVIFIIKSFFISQSLNELSSSGLINIRRRNFISTTIYGNVCAFYHIDCQTFLEIISKISPIQNLCQLLELISLSSEFSSFSPRKNENYELDRLANIVPIPVKFSKKTKDFKVNVLVQSYIENIFIKSESLQIDCSYICKKALKISRIMFEISLLKKWANVTQLCINLYLAIKNRGWYNQKDIWKSLKGRIKKKYSEFFKKKNLSLFGIQNLKKKELEYTLNSKRGTIGLLESITFLPFFDLEISVEPITRYTLKVYINLVLLISKLNHSTEQFVGIWIFIEDQICDTLIYSKYLALKNLSLKKNYKFFFLLPILENPFSPYYSIKLKFEHNPILNTEYIVDLTKILYPLNLSMETFVPNFRKVPMSRFLLGFKTGSVLREYFCSHLKKLDNCFSNNMHIGLKAGQNKIFGIFGKKLKRFFQEFSVIISFLMKKNCNIFFLKNPIENISSKIQQFKKGMIGFIGISVKTFFPDPTRIKKFRSQKKVFYFLKKLEIFSILKKFQFLNNVYLILIIDLTATSFNLEMGSSYELILETLSVETNGVKNLSIILSTSRLSNSFDLIKIIKLKNILLTYPLKKPDNRKFKKIGSSSEMMRNSMYKNEKFETFKSLNIFNFKKSFWKNKIVYLSFNIKNSLKKLIKSILSSNNFFSLDLNPTLKKKYIKFYILKKNYFTKSQKFFFCLGYGIHDFNFNYKKRKFSEELNLAGFFKMYWISIFSLIKIPTEKLYFSICILDNFILDKYPFDIYLYIFNILSESCEKIIINTREYTSSKTLNHSFDLSFESSWKKYYLEKCLMLFDFKRLELFKKNSIYNKLKFLITRIHRNPQHYFGHNRIFKTIPVKKFLVNLFVKLKKNRIFYFISKNCLKKTLKGIIMSKYFCLEITSRFMIREFFLKKSKFKINRMIPLIKSFLKLNFKETRTLDWLNEKVKFLGKKFFQIKFNMSYLLYSQKKYIYSLIVLEEMSEFFDQFNFILLCKEKVHQELIKNFKAGSKIFKFTRINEFSILLLIKVHKILDSSSFLKFFALSGVKKLTCFKILVLLNKLKNLKEVEKWKLSLFKLKNGVNINKTGIILFPSKFSNETSSLENKIEIGFIKKIFFWWILIGEKNTNKIIGKFNMICNKKIDYKIILCFIQKFYDYKIFIINEDFVYYN